MALEIRTTRLEMTDALREHVEKRFLTATKRFAKLLRAYYIRLEDVNGPRGGPNDKVCKVYAVIAPGENLIIAESNVDLYQAIDSAASRFKQVLSRRVNRFPAAHRRVQRVLPTGEKPARARPRTHRRAPARAKTRSR